MTRRRFYAPPSAFALSEQTVSLSADEARHARDVLRLQRGDEVYVFDGAGKEFRCEVREFTRHGAVMGLGEEVAPAQPESSLDLTLAIALLKGEKFELVVQKTSELGVNRIVPFEAERADVKVRDKNDSDKRITRWRRIALEAAKQSGRARVTEISAPVAFESLLAEKESASTDVTGIMFSERGGQSWSEAFGEINGRPERVFAITGPEGGWTDNEIELARTSLWRIVTLGGRTLRAETAAIVAATLLQHRFGDLA